jgi:hypothetical protein
MGTDKKNNTAMLNNNTKNDQVSIGAALAAAVAVTAASINARDSCTLQKEKE